MREHIEISGYPGKRIPGIVSMVVTLKLNKMEMFIIYSLPGDYARVVYHPAEKAGISGKMQFARKNENGQEKANRLFRELTEEYTRLTEENRLLTEELNELYVRYDKMSSALGEMERLVKAAAHVPERYGKEGAL